MEDKCVWIILFNLSHNINKRLICLVESRLIFLMAFLTVY